MTLIRNAMAVVATALLATAAAPAFAQNSNSGPFDGFYVGGEIGAIRSNSKAIVVPLTGAALSTKSDRTNADYGLFVGYGTTFAERFYLSSDLEIGSGPGKSKTVAVGGINTQERANYEAALTTRLGFMLTEDTALYAMAGSVLRESKFTIAGSRVRTATVSGSSFGIGLMQACTDNIFIRAELASTDFNKKSFAAASQPTTRYQPKSTMLNIGIGYRF
jgi:opacity protein-like surface antigen